MIGDLAAVPLRLRPARLVREIGGDGEIFAIAFDPADGLDVAEYVAIRMLVPQRALDVVRLHRVRDRRVDLEVDAAPARFG